ncbi:MAG: hypothetical protein CME68_01545 [Halobacteriovoraceae bacterium]|nr:hypothetical protein [Halobacteriovoraceae bacterium]
MKINYLHLIYEKGQRRGNSLRKFLLDEKNHTIQSKSKSNQLIESIPTKLSNNLFSSVIVYLDLDGFGFKALHNLVLKVINKKNIKEIICLGSKKSAPLFEKLNGKLKKNLVYMADPLNPSAYRSIIFNLLEKESLKKPQAVKTKGSFSNESVFFQKLPTINVGVNSILYDVRNTINVIKVLGDQIVGHSGSDEPKSSSLQKGIYCYCDDFLSLISDLIGTPDSLSSQRRNLFKVKSILDYILEKYEKVFDVLGVLITCEDGEDREVYLDNYWVKRVLSYLVTSCQRELVTKEIENPKMHLSFENKDDFHIFELKTNNTKTTDREIKEIFKFFEFDEAKDRSGLGFLMLQEFLTAYQSKIEVMNEASGLLFKIKIPKKTK